MKLAGQCSVLAATLLFSLGWTPAFADDPVAIYNQVNEAGDTRLGCNDLNIAIANAQSDIGRLEAQEESLQQVIAEGAPNDGPQSTNLGNAFAAMANAFGTAAVVDAESSLPNVQSSLSTARARVGYLESLQGSCAANDAPAPQATLMCRYTAGPKAGYVEDFRGTTAKPALVDRGCGDGRGSIGLGIAETPPVATLVCHYFNGPKSGQTEDFRGRNARPATVGAGCTDGAGSTGLGVPQP